ncbi:hypothetical protein GC174_15135 [bacterium]|nr:hypothetical protein [bacterium]
MTKTIEYTKHELDQIQKAALLAKAEFEQLLKTRKEEGDNPRVLIPSDEGRDSLVPSPQNICIWTSWGVIGHGWHSLDWNFEPAEMMEVLQKHFQGLPVYLGPNLPDGSLLIKRTVPWGKKPLVIKVDQIPKHPGGISSYHKGSWLYRELPIEMHDGSKTGPRRSLTVQFTFSRQNSYEIFDYEFEHSLDWYIDIYLLLGIEKRGFPWLKLEPQTKSRMRMLGAEIKVKGAFYKALIRNLDEIMEEIIDAYCKGNFDYQWLGEGEPR